MFIVNNRVNIFLVLMFVINNHTERFVGIVCYIKHIAVLATTISAVFSTLGEKNKKIIGIHMIHYGACTKTTNF